MLDRQSGMDTSKLLQRRTLVRVRRLRVAHHSWNLAKGSKSTRVPTSTLCLKFYPCSISSFLQLQYLEHWVREIRETKSRKPVFFPAILGGSMWFLFFSPLPMGNGNRASSVDFTERPWREFHRATEDLLELVSRGFQHLSRGILRYLHTQICIHMYIYIYT